MIPAIHYIFSTVQEYTAMDGRISVPSDLEGLGLWPTVKYYMMIYLSEVTKNKKKNLG
jgi:hypothetical protein